MTEIVNKKFYEDRYAKIKYVLTSDIITRENFKLPNQ